MQFSVRAGFKFKALRIKSRVYGRKAGLGLLGLVALPFYIVYLVPLGVYKLYRRVKARR